MDADRFAAIALAVYILGMIVTFGHSANKPCDPTTPAKLCQEQVVVYGIFSSIFWPFYVSMEAWKP